MKRNIIVVVLFINFVFYVSGSGLDANLFMNPEISRVESYRNGLPSLRSDYVKEGNKIIVYQTEIRSMQTHINREYIFGDSVIEVNNYYPDGFRYSYSKYIYLNGLLKIHEYESKLRYEGIPEAIRDSDRFEYFYDSNRNLLRVVGSGFERDYIYSSGNLVSIERVNRRGERRSERVERINGNTVHTPSYDLYIMTDRKVIENRIDGNTKTTIITYYLDGEVFEEQRYIYVNDRLESARTYNSWIRDVFEYKFFY